MIVGGVVVLVAILAVGGWWALRERTPVPVVAATTSMATRPAAYSPEDRRMSVIVLPFENSSGDPRQDSQAVKMTRDVTNRIAQDSTKPIVPAQTASAYRGKSVDLHAIRQTHNVHFAVTGSVRLQNGRLMVSVNVFDTEDDRSVWSDQFNEDDREENYQAILQKIGSGFDQISVDVEAAKAMQEHPNALDKRDLMIAASASSLLPSTKNNFLTKIALVEKALALDPDFLWALRTSAALSANLILSGYSTDAKAESARALTRIDRALELAPNDFGTLEQKVRVLRIEGDIDGAEALTRELIRMNPLSAYQYWNLGIIRLIQGHPEEMLTNMQIARRLVAVGNDPSLYDVYLALALLANGHFADSISQARLAAAESPTVSRNGDISGMMLIAAEYLNGNEEQAKADLKHFLATPRTLSTLKAVQSAPSLANIPKLVDALRQAGMPEQ
jgi:TolB-like protein